MKKQIRVSTAKSRFNNYFGEENDLWPEIDPHRMEQARSVDWQINMEDVECILTDDIDINNLKSVRYMTDDELAGLSDRYEGGYVFMYWDGEESEFVWRSYPRNLEPLVNADDQEELVGSDDLDKKIARMKAIGDKKTPIIDEVIQMSDKELTSYLKENGIMDDYKDAYNMRQDLSVKKIKQLLVQNHMQGKGVTASTDYDDDYDWDSDERSDGEIVSDAEYDDGLMDIENEVLDDLGLYVDFSSVRGDYGPIWFFSDPEHENNADMWMGDLEDALKKMDYSDYCSSLVTDVIMQPKDQWKDRYRKYIIKLVGAENVTASTDFDGEDVYVVRIIHEVEPDYDAPNGPQVGEEILWIKAFSPEEAIQCAEEEFEGSFERIDIVGINPDSNEEYLPFD